jgi:hypothetical protein
MDSVFKNGSRVISDRFEGVGVLSIFRRCDLVFAVTPITRLNYYFAYFTPDVR